MGITKRVYLKNRALEVRGVFTILSPKPCDGGAETIRCAGGGRREEDSSGFLEAIPVTFSNDDARLPPRFQLLSNPGDCHFDDVGVGVEVQLPNMAEKVTATQDLLGPGNEKAQDLELLEGEPDTDGPSGHTALHLIQLDIAKSQYERRRAIGPAGKRLHPGQKNTHVERLGNVVVGTGLETPYDIFIRIAGGHHEDGKLLVPGTQLSDHREAVHARKPDVQNDEVVGTFRYQRESFFPRTRHIRLYAPGQEDIPHEFRHPYIIFDDQYLQYLHGFDVGADLSDRRTL